MNGARYTVGSITRALYSGVEGELPFEYWDKLRVEFIDLEGANDGFATIDYSETPPLLFVGKYVTFDDLRLTNLRDDTLAPAARRRRTSKDSTARSAARRSSFEPERSRRSVACPSCAAILDARDPNLAVLQEHQQRTGRVEPAIPLGTTARSAEKWQAIGFQVRGITVDGRGRTAGASICSGTPSGGFATSPSTTATGTT